MIDPVSLSNLPKLPQLKLAVIGHIEWVNFISVDTIPIPGKISHGFNSIEEPAGGGALAAVQLQRLTKGEVHFFTALGKDDIGEKSLQRLTKLGIKVKAAWREKPTRRGISFVDPRGERAITVMGERLQPTSNKVLNLNFESFLINSCSPFS